MTRPSLLAPALAAALALGSGAAVLAQPVGAPEGSSRPSRISPAQWQKIFPENRQLALQDHRARLAILQRGERCISAAASADTLRSCMREERTAMQQQRRQHMNAMRALFERNGIPMPDWSQRRRGGGGAGGAGGWGGDGGV